MSRATLTELHAHTEAIVKRVSAGETVTIVQDGEAVAQLQPVFKLRPTRPMPDREALIQALPRSMDSGLILEEDRS
jgi:prevent-host-death family protein